MNAEKANIQTGVDAAEIPEYVFESLARSLLPVIQSTTKVKTAKRHLPIGKQSIKELIGQNQGVSSIPIEKTDLKGFEQVARKYGVDYAITKDQNVIPPKYTVFFKAKDADALTSAFEEFTNRKLKAKEKPSVLEQLNKLKELVAAILPDKVRHKSQERDL